MLLPDGSRLAPVDTMMRLWSGQTPVSPCPIIHNFRLTGIDQLAPVGTIQAVVDVTSPQNKPLKVTWVLQAETGAYHTGGAAEGTLPTYPKGDYQIRSW